MTFLNFGRILIVLISSPSICLAQQLPDNSPIVAMELRAGKFVTQSENLSVLVQAMERSLPMIASIGPSTLYDDAIPGSNGSVEVVVKSAKTAIGEVKTAFQKSLQETKKKRNRELSFDVELNKPDKSKQSASPPVVPLAVEAISPQSWRQFCRCVKVTLPALKTRIRLARTQNLALAYQLDSQLAMERGDGKVVSPQGIACGKFLGLDGVDRQEESEDILTLAALSSRKSEEDAQRLGHYYKLYAASLRSENIHAPAFWKFTWKKVAFESVFSTRAIPPYVKALNSFVGYSRQVVTKNQTRKAEFIVSAKSLQGSAEKDWNDSRFVGGEVMTPCSK